MVLTNIMRRALFTLIVVMPAQFGFSQTTRYSERNTVAWLTAIVTPKISKKVSGHLEYQWRRVNFVKDWQQSLLRGGITYKIHPQLSVQLGYAWVQTFPYGTYTIASVPKVFPEHRIYEQLVINSPIGSATLINRLRLEQRWTGRFSPVEAEKLNLIFFNRFRYMPRVDVSINNKMYAALADEILIGFGENVGENVFDQNRVNVMLGYKASNVFKIEGGFLNQIVQLGREIEMKNVFQYNSGFMVNMYFDF